MIATEAIAYSRAQVAPSDERWAAWVGRGLAHVVGIVVVLTAVVITPRMRVPGGVNSVNLGWMSEHWVAEHRASHTL
jgi:hypothetical protein